MSCRVAAALEQGGGQVASGGSLARGMTHVVCQPDQALKWLSLGEQAWWMQPLLSFSTSQSIRCLQPPNSSH